MEAFAAIDQRLQQGGGHVLCLGAHCDDIDIGAGGALLTWLNRWPDTRVTWVALTSNDERAAELRESASLFLAEAGRFEVLTQTFRNGFFPTEFNGIKAFFESLKALPNPDLILTHQRDDRHQDHRTVCDLTWNTFRNHCVLEYEIAKFDGELERPNAFVALSEDIMQRKIDILMQCYRSQLDKQWFDEDLFRGLARLRGVECASPTRFAEAFVARKLLL
ncbi:MAG: PIG-L deacetylase family protein [Pseudomonadota bacterium]